MKTVTFFSYKGGVGRTLAAANFAVYLAKLGLKVVIMDFDLDAPGVDSKFPDFTLPSGQLGLIDYILRFQRDGSDPGPVTGIVCNVPISSPRQEYSLSLIPAGDYLGADYSAKLNELSWSAIFSKNRDGVAFFQVFLDRLRQELAPDVLVIDSRTGFSEIGGLCTQQLADETVILSSLASESVKMTRHLAKVIRDSEIAKQLSKKVETKIVVSRVPRSTEIDKLKARCCKLFDVDETRLFFLFSCPTLEQEEFVAMLNTAKEDALVANYMQLFQGLEIEKAKKNIRDQIERAGSGLLSLPAGGAAEADARIRELVALYPDPEVYRVAMRFFEFRRQSEEASRFALRVLDFMPSDDEATMQIARTLLSSDTSIHFGPFGRSERISESESRRLLAIAQRAFEIGNLGLKQKVRLAGMLEQMKNVAKSYEIACDCLNSKDLSDPELRSSVLGIAARTAMKLGKKDDAAKLIAGLPPSRLNSGLATVAIRLKLEAKDKEGAFEIAKAVLSSEFDRDVLEIAVPLSAELGRRNELDEAIRVNREVQIHTMHHPEILWELERFGFDVEELRERVRPRRKRP